MQFKDFYLIVGSLCWLISLTSIVFNRQKYLKLFSFFILISVSVEWVAWYMGKKLHMNNLWLYNYYTLFEFMYLGFFYSLFIRSKRIQTSIRYFYFTYPIAYFINLFFIQGLTVFNTYSYFLGSTMILILIIAWFKEILFDANNIVLTGEPVFYISIAFFSFFIIEIPYTILLPYFSIHDHAIAIALIWLLKILNIALYILFSIAYLCKQRIQTSSFI